MLSTRINGGRIPTGYSQRRKVGFIVDFDISLLPAPKKEILSEGETNSANEEEFDELA